jgi:hypothetical protein
MSSELETVRVSKDTASHCLSVISEGRNCLRAEFSPKNHAKELQRRHAQSGGRRRNKKESKKRGYKIRQAKNIKADLKPHNEGEKSEQTVEERNEIARAVLSPDNGDFSDAKKDEEFQDLLDSFTSFAGENLSEEADFWVSHIENVLLYAWHLKKADSVTDVIVATMSYVKMCTKQSVTMSILKLVDTMCKRQEELPANALSGETIVRGWETFKSNPIFSKMSYLISIAMSVSACSIKKLEWQPFGFEFISIEAMKEQVKAVDVIDAVLKTFTWMLSTGYKCIMTQSLTPILFGDQKMHEFQENCDYVLANQHKFLSGNGGDIGPYEKKVDEALQQVAAMKRVKPDAATSFWLQNKYTELTILKEKIVGKHRNTTQRLQPFGVGITGSSGVGKTILGGLTMRVGLEAWGVEYDDSRIITEDQDDKWDSLVTSDIIGIFNDDVGQTKKEFATKSVAGKAVKRVNNVPAQALKAELHEKNSVFYNHLMDVMTSNFTDYTFSSVAEYPAAGLRRYIHVRASVKEEYRKPGSVSLNTEHPDLKVGGPIHDVWDLTIEECHIFENRHGKDSYTFRPITVTALDGTKIFCKNIGLKDYLKALVALVTRHHEKQKQAISASKELKTLDMCSETKVPTCLCDCVTCEKKRLGANGLEQIVIEAGKQALSNYVQSWWAPISWVRQVLQCRPVAQLATAKLSHEISCVLREECTPYLISIAPEWLFQTKVFQRSVDMWAATSAMYDVKTLFKLLNWISLCLYLIVLYCRSYTSGACVLLVQGCLTFYLWSMYRARKKQLLSEFRVRRDVVPTYAKEWMESNLVKGSIAVVATGVLIKFLCMWNKNRVAKLQANSNLSPDTIDAQESWFGSLFKFTSSKVEAAGDTTGVLSDDMVRAFSKNNLFFADFTFSDGRKTATNIYFPRKNIALIPYHVYFKGSQITDETPDMRISVKVYRHKNQAGGIHEFECDATTCVVSKDHDLVMLWTPKCPDYIDRSDWFVKDKPQGNGFCHFLAKGREESKSERVYITYGDQRHANWKKTYWGGRYGTSIARPGTCMGLVMSDTKNPCIVGFHIAGSTSEGSMQTLTFDEYEKMLEAIQQHSNVLLSAHAVKLPEEQYGRPLITSTVPHPNSMAAKLGPEACVEVLGSTRLRSKQRSVVEKSILSDKIEEHFKVPNKWGPPKMEPNWKAYNATLEYIVNPGKMFPPVLLERARQDWITPLKEAMSEFVEKEQVQPLTLKESILGIPGKRFMDALPMQTSMGFPIFGPKNKWFTEIREGEQLIDRIPDPEVKKEIDRMLACWDRGERAYPVVSATLKDEPTKLESEKVRVFQASGVAMSVCIRMYFLPILRFLQLHPILAESAVGINAFGPQWEEMIDHARKFNELMLALDHSKFDVRANSQVTTAVWQSFVELGEVAQYDEKSLHRMVMMIADIVNPLIDYNGVLIMALSMNTSGNNLTVNVNGGVNALYMRMGFFSVYPKLNNFRMYVSIITYGDDLIGSVVPECSEFNFISLKRFLATFGLKITPPNKTDEEMEYLPFEEADFLKRKSNYIPDIDRSIGMLEKDSIFKSLHRNLKSTTATKREIAISCIDGAMHEMFAHGKDNFLDFQEKMTKVCRDLDLMVPSVTATWDDRVNHWLQKYDPTRLANSVKGSISPHSKIEYMTAESGCYAKTQY